MKPTTIREALDAVVNLKHQIEVNQGQLAILKRDHSQIAALTKGCKETIVIQGLRGKNAYVSAEGYKELLKVHIEAAHGEMEKYQAVIAMADLAVKGMAGGEDETI